MKGKSRIRGPSVIKHWTKKLDFSFERSIFVWNCATLFLFLFILYSQAGETNFGTPGKYVEPKGLWILRGWVGWSNSKNLIQGRNWSFVQNFLWGNFMWQKQDQMVELFSGKFWENIINVLLNDDNTKRVQHSLILLLEPLQMRGGTNMLGLRAAARDDTATSLSQAV